MAPPDSAACAADLGVEREEEKRARIRLRMPAANGIGRGAVAHDHGVHGRSQKALDEERRRCVGADEVRKRAEHRARTKLLTIAQQACGRRGEPDALALESLERAELAVHSGVLFFHPANLGAGGSVALAPVTRGVVRGRERRVRFGGGGGRDGELLVGDFQFALRQPLLRGELFVFAGELVRALRHIGELTLRTFALELEPAEAVAHLAPELLGAVECVAPDGDGAARFFLGADVALERSDGLGERRRCALFFLARGFILGHDAFPECGALAPFLLRARPARERIAMALFGDGNFPLQREQRFTRIADHLVALVAACFGRCTRGMRRIACVLRVEHDLLRARSFRAQLLE